MVSLLLVIIVAIIAAVVDASSVLCVVPAVHHASIGGSRGAVLVW